MKLLIRFFSLILIAATIIQSSLSAHQNLDLSSWCDGWSLEVHGGIAPILWHQRDCFLLSNCLSATTTPNISQLTPLARLPKFHDMYHLPFDVGFTIGYILDECIEIIGQFDYRGAKAKECQNCQPEVPNAGQLNFCYTTTLSASNTHIFISNIDRYQSYSGHLGVKWYHDSCFCDVSWFLGLKAGFVHHKEINVTINRIIRTGDLVEITQTPYPFSCVPLFCKNTTISAGALIGIEWCLQTNFAFVLQAEVLGQGPLRASHNLGSFNCINCCPSKIRSCVALATSQPLTTDIVGADFNTEIIVPITVGLKYYF